MRSLSAALCVLSLAVSVGAQASTVYFSPRYAETPASGRGGFIVDQAAPCLPAPLFGNGFVIESAVANSQGVCYVTPGVVNSTVLNSMPPMQVNDFVEVSNFPQFNIYLGDMDGDGLAHESSNFRGVDAMYIPTPAVGRPNNIHEMFVSVWDDSTGTQGYTAGTITESDMVLLRPASTAYPVNSAGGSPIYFARRADWITLLGLPTGTTAGIDLNAFTVDQSTGDIYCSFDNTMITGAMLRVSAGGAVFMTTIQRGDIIRIPAAAYTPSGQYGIVTSPVSGMAERVIGTNQVANMVNAAGGTNTTSPPVNVYSLSIDPAGGTTTTLGSFVIPDLLFTIFNQGGQPPAAPNMSSSAIYSTTGGGAFAVLNGTTMDQPASAGMHTNSFNNAFYAGPLDAMSVVQHTPNLSPTGDRPVHLDTFPTNGIVSDPTYNGTIACYVSGLPPGGIAAIFARVDIVGTGGWVSRTGINSSLPGYPDLYVDPAGLHNQQCVLAPQNSIVGGLCQNPAAQVLFNNPSANSANPDPNQMINPIAVYTDPTNGAQNGDTCFQIDLASLIAPGAVAPSPPPIITIQVLDLNTARLSSPIALQLN